MLRCDRVVVNSSDQNSVVGAFVFVLRKYRQGGETGRLSAVYFPAQYHGAFLLAPVSFSFLIMRSYEYVLEPLPKIAQAPGFHWL